VCSFRCLLSNSYIQQFYSLHSFSPLFTAKFDAERLLFQVSHFLDVTKSQMEQNTVVLYTIHKSQVLQPNSKLDMSQQNVFYLHPAVVHTCSSNVISPLAHKLIDCTTCVKPGCSRRPRYIFRWVDTTQTSIKRKWNIVHIHCKLSVYQCSLSQYTDIST
jgi:hypothetical protein